MGELINRVRIGGTCEPWIWEEFRKLSIKTRIPQTKLLDEALMDLLVKHKAIALDRLKNKDS